MRSEEVAKLICGEFPGLSETAQLYLSAPLEHLCVPGFEGRLQSLLDLDFGYELVAPNLAGALVLLGTKEGINAARDAFVLNAHDPEFQRVQELLYCYRRLRGDDAHELGRWRGELEALRHRTAQSLKRPLGAIPMSNSFKPAVPNFNPFEEVGRNDLCPCGSGRKFKRCCLPKSN